MRKKILLGFFIGFCLIGASGCQVRQDTAKQKNTGILMDGEALPNIRQGAERYIYLEDLLNHGFIWDAEESGVSFQEEGRINLFVLWTEGCHEVKKTTKAPVLRLHSDIPNQTYINGLEISTYSLEGKPVILVSELCDPSFTSLSKIEMAADLEAVYYDAQGGETSLQATVQLISAQTGSSLDGDCETSDVFQFENCSPFLVGAMEAEEQNTISLHVFQKGEMIETAKGSFPFYEIFAGEHNGMKLTTLSEYYTNFSSVLENLDLEYTMENGVLTVEGSGNGRICATDRPEAIQSLQYYPARMIRTKLNVGTLQTMECLYTGNSLYLCREEMKIKGILKKNGYAYKDYCWYPEQKR